MTDIKPNPLTMFRDRFIAERDGIAEALQERSAEQAKARARSAYLAHGGDEAAFEKAYPAIRSRIIADKTIEALREKR
jgi:hypothetical protein